MTEYETARDQLIFALDVPDGERARQMAYVLKDHVGCFKIGLELFIASGPAIVRDIAELAPVFLDLKLHDTPATMARVVAVVKNLGARFLTVHVGDEGKALPAAVAAAEGQVNLLAVTVLTNCQDATAVLPRAHMAQDAGCWGVVCSGHETAQIHAAYPRLKIVNPGIRLAGESADDQARVVTPIKAINAGAELLVVGRPIRDADNPVLMADEIVAEIQRGK